mmetsp:Transcript_10129/g.18398  ORF Transcript_10129/g.18398 Transcript_10129/m.18398 type:complete len:301 (+) Transcript_10129:342-1244(+)
MRNLATMCRSSSTTQLKKAAVAKSRGVVSWNLALFTILVSLIYVSDLHGRLGAFLHSFKDRPQDELQAFAQYHADKSMLIQKNVVDQLPTDSFKMFAQAACAKQLDTTIEACRQTLALQLRQLPLETRTEIIESVVIDGVTQKNSDSNTVTHLADDGKASSYLAFWSTTYSNFLGKDTYQTCIIAAEVEFQAAEVVADYQVQTTYRNHGKEACNCGYFYCSTCPVLRPHVSKNPIFKRNSLSLAQQIEPHHWMVDRTVENIKNVFGKPIHYEPLSPANAAELADLGWEAASLHFHELAGW